MVQRIRDDLKSLVQAGDGVRVSLYFPTHRQSSKTLEDRLRLKNLLKRAETKLSDRGVSAHCAKSILEPAYEFWMDDHFWLKQQDGMAILLREGD